jgi:hypothetical protein
MMLKRFFRAKCTGPFKARSPERDIGADAESVQSILGAINLALKMSEAERAGLKRRLDQITSDAAIVAGNDLDDYLTRTADRLQMLDISDVEMHRAEARLNTIDRNISHFKFLKTAVHTRFPDSKR